MEIHNINNQKLQEYGILTISLDFELYWGMRDKVLLEDYHENLLGVSKAIPMILDLFKKYEIHATWATGGFVFYNDWNSLIEDLPTNKPSYNNKVLSPYIYIEKFQRNNSLKKYHFAPTLIKKIKNYLYQEIGTHTFSHYYCLEEGQDLESFRADLNCAIKISKKFGFSIESIVFPRNQTNHDYLKICKEVGIKSFRGNQLSWIYRPKKEENLSFIIKLLRFIDRNFNLTGHNTYSFNQIAKTIPLNIKASRFLYWYSKRFKVLEPLRLKRILKDLSYAAKRNELYHLWWHPHNFGVHISENLLFLEKILIHFKKLKNKYGMKSLNMGELPHQLI